MVSYSIAITLLLSLLSPSMCKIYSRCELARELYYKHGVQMSELGTWVCIAKYESGYDTAARNYQTGDHGIFQISQIYWCYPPGQGCGISCDRLRDDDITDDFNCVKTIFKETQRLKGNGFLAWTVYPRCKNNEVTSKLIQGCI